MIQFIIFYIILLIIIVYLLFSFRDIMGVSIAILYFLIITSIVIASFFMLKNMFYFIIIGVTLVLFTIGLISSLSIYSSYSMFYI